MEKKLRPTDDLLKELEEVRAQLYEAQETIEAIRTGQVDALVVKNGAEHQLYTLTSADHAYRVFIEKMTEGAVTLNSEGVILYANSQFATMVGLPLSKVMGISFRNFIVDSFKPFYDTLFQTGWQGDCKGEVEISHDHGLTAVQLSLTPLEMAEGISLSIIITDLTIQKDTQKQLEDYNKRLELLNESLEASNQDLLQFASVASHDLQEPIRKMLLFANLLKAEGDGRFSVTDLNYLDKIIGSASRMRKLVIDVLNYSKLSANDGAFSPVDINDVLKELLEDFEPEIEEKKAKIIFTELPVLEVNRGQIRQVFQNLISNALKFIKPDKTPVIEITSKRLVEKSFSSKEASKGAYCLFTVKDNGIGFDEKYIPNIFSLFERLHPKERYEGSGIGLAIAKRIIEKHHGLINVKSTVGLGSEFEIILPFVHSI